MNTVRHELNCLDDYADQIQQELNNLSCFADIQKMSITNALRKDLIESAAYHMNDNIIRSVQNIKCKVKAIADTMNQDKQINDMLSEEKYHEKIHET